MRSTIKRTLGIFIVVSLASFCVLDLTRELFTTGSEGTHARNGIGSHSAIGDVDGASLLIQQGPGQLGRELHNISDRAHQRTHYLTLRAFRESIGDSWKSTVQIIVRNQQAALGAILHPDGWIVSKSSEVPEKFDVKLADNSKAVGVVKARNEEMDLVLIKIERSGLQPIVWSTSYEVPVGAWLVSTDTRSVPLSIGVLSVANRNVRREKPVLGVRLGPTSDGSKGAVVESIVDGGGADRAGIEIGDVIQEIDGKSYDIMDDVLYRLRELKAGETVNMSILRKSKKVTLAAQMMDLTNSLFDSTEMEVNGQISARATGFQNVMQHDTVLLPHQCGGPILDVEGKAVGLNIARSGRVASLAYHARNLEPVLRNMLRSANAPGDLLVENSYVTTAAAMEIGGPTAATSIPVSVPKSIQVETLKPEIVLPGAK